MTYPIDSFPGREITIAEKKYRYFGGTAYLGLQTDTEFQELFIKNIRKYGTNYGASRKSNVQIEIFKKTEQYLAHFIGSQDCITLSSGFLAGQVVAKTLYDSNAYTFFYSPDTHAALHLPNHKPFASFDDLNNALRKHLSVQKTTPVVFLDTIDTAGENYPNFDAIKKLPLNKIILVADDSHGIGIVGDNGSGAYKKLAALLPKELIVCCSLGKGFGIQAGAVFGTKQRISECSDSELFGGASPASPAALATLIEGERIFSKKRKRLQENIALFLKTLHRTQQLNYLQNHPAFYFYSPKMAAHLEQHNIVITHFNYPNKKGNLISRIVLSAAHTQEDIEFLSNAINSFKN